MITPEERAYLLRNMESLLNKYYYSTSDSALNRIINEWASKKGALIEAFKKHPDYLPGKFMIVFDSDYEREIDTNESEVFFNFLSYNAMPQGKNNLPKEIKDRCKMYEYLPYDIYYFFSHLYRFADRCVDDDTAKYLNRACPEVKAHPGEKTSRLVNRLCRYLGYNKADGYEKAFARYSDSLSPKVIKRHTIISINPLDYFTMSFGNSWASCHSIDKTNQRGMPHNYSGEYSSGTMSYMLDGSSMVMYTVDSSYNGDEYWNEPKINRQMFHWGEDKLVQGRLYPQSNDGKNGLYTPYRNIVQNIMSAIFEFPNSWTLKKGYNEASRYIRSYGTHYCDYECFDSCTLSIVKGSTNINKFVVGADPICVTCGEDHENCENISCCGGGGVQFCENCGYDYDEDDMYYIDGYWYCDDCVSYCECCDTHYVGDSYHIVDEDIYVCDDCIDEFVCCDNCSDYNSEEGSTYIEEMDVTLCNECLSRYTARCSECGERHYRSEMHFDGYEYICNDCHDRLEDREETE